MDKEKLEKELGFKIGDDTYERAVSQAKQKLQSLIRRYGDSDGVRRTPEYLAELVIEAIMQKLFSEYTIAQSELLRSYPYCNMGENQNQ